MMKLRNQFSKKSIKNLIQIIKWVILFVFLFIVWHYFQWDQFSNILTNLSIKAIFLYVLVIFISRILYAFRWKLIASVVIKNIQIKLGYFLQTNFLAEFVTIVMPTSLGGEVARVLKLNYRGSRTTLSAASILIDRALGIAGMLAVSLISLVLIGKKISF
ncbi:MAG TPA: lysylphosphatidylglycerol synthase domain-containing protein, partial [Pelolinea sp.]|nr:lysylphosphatidylglycerol synthase domain-containing protein [Pelolinea sp.]